MTMVKLTCIMGCSGLKSASGKRSIGATTSLTRDAALMSIVTRSNVNFDSKRLIEAPRKINIRLFPTYLPNM